MFLRISCHKLSLLAGKCQLNIVFFGNFVLHMSIHLSITCKIPPTMNKKFGNHILEKYLIFSKWLISDKQNWKNSIYLKFAFRHPIWYNNYVGFVYACITYILKTFTDRYLCQIMFFFHSEIWPLWANAANQIFQDVIFNLFWFFGGI